MRHSSDNASGSGRNKFPAVSAYIRMLCIAYLVSALLLLFLAFLLLQMKLGSGPVRAMVYAIYAIVCAAGGFLIGKSSGQRRFLWGLLFGAFYFLILLGVSFAIGRAICQGSGNLMAALGICLAAGCVGGMLS